jgi:tripartite-type tricarboxylate transporter receptor subunit TctC
MNRLLISLMLMIAVIGLAIVGHSQAATGTKVEFPEKGKTVSIIVPFAAGNTVDIGSRLVAVGLQKELGVPFLVVNKPGAGMQVGTTALVLARPDGYTLGAVNATTLLTYLDPERKTIYDRKSFVPLAVFMSEPVGVAVIASSPYKTMKDLVDAANAKPREIKAGDGGLMGSTHLTSILVQKAAGIKFSSVHFDGAAPGMTALLGGHLDVGVFGCGNLAAPFKDGQIRVLGVVDKQEYSFLPGVKTLQAQGYNAAFAVPNGIAAPAGTPKEIVEILSGAMKRVVNSGSFKQKMDEVGRDWMYMDAAEFARYWAETEEMLRPLMETAKKER